MSNPLPPILDYRAPRPRHLRAAWRHHPAIHFVPILSPIVIGWVYVIRAILDYCTGMAPFPGAAVIVSLLTLAGSIGLGLALRGRR